jgi:hypothetical protein
MSATTWSSLTYENNSYLTTLYVKIRFYFQNNLFEDLLWKYLYSLAPIFVVSAKYIDPWVFEFVLSNSTDNNQWENCISLHFLFRGLSVAFNKSWAAV